MLNKTLSATFLYIKQYDFYLVSDVNKFINTFHVLQNVKYLENCLDNIHGFLARRV